MSQYLPVSLVREPGTPAVASDMRFVAGRRSSTGRAQGECRFLAFAVERDHARNRAIRSPDVRCLAATAAPSRLPVFPDRPAAEHGNRRATVGSRMLRQLMRVIAPWARTGQRLVDPCPAPRSAGRRVRARHPAAGTGVGPPGLRPARRESHARSRAATDRPTARIAGQIGQVVAHETDRFQRRCPALRRAARHAGEFVFHADVRNAASADSFGAIGARTMRCGVR